MTRRKYFPYPCLLTIKVEQELIKRKTEFKELVPYFIVVGINSKTIRTADEEIVLVSILCPNLRVVTEDYHLRRKVSGTSVKKLLYGY